MSAGGGDVDLMRVCMQAAVRDVALVTEYFHEELFRIAPETRKLFRMDLGSQGELLINRMSMVMSQMHDVESLRPFLEDLAVRHVGYGALPEHYPLVRQALLTALRRLLGTRFTPEVEAAWTAAYDRLAGFMIDIGYANSPR